VALGVNCTAPRHVPELLERLRQVTDLPLVAYPNSGERYAAETGRWAGAGSDLAAACLAWRAAGARLIGGCCRTTPATIRALRRALLAQTGPG
jgi:homocysteine S-methyltransferase